MEVENQEPQGMEKKKDGEGKYKRLKFGCKMK